MPDVYAVPTARYCQYDGTNSAEIVDIIEANPRDVDIQNVSVASESDSVLVIEWAYKYRGENAVMTETVTMNEGDWIEGYLSVIPEAVFAATYIVKEVPSP